MGRKFRKHKLAMFGTTLIVLFYVMAIFCEFIAPQDPFKRNTDFIHVPPQPIHLFGAQGIGPFVYGLKAEEDPKTWRRIYVPDPTVEIPIRFFVRGDSYRLWGLFETDDSGRDMFSRTLYGIRISMSIGLVGVAFTFILGSVLGAISGYYGGVVDFIIQRIIEFILCIPAIPLWMALSAAVPKDWPPTQVYFAISIILSLIGWCGLARVVRGKMLGVLLQQAQNVKTISLYPWLMIPGLFIFFAVLAFNFMGDGLRDAADPYK